MIISPQLPQFLSYGQHTRASDTSEPPTRIITAAAASSRPLVGGRRQARAVDDFTAFQLLFLEHEPRSGAPASK